MRGLQELSFDTLKSCKALELEVTPSLLFPIPHDYVNYIRLTWTDENGKCHPINSCRECFKDPISYVQDTKTGGDGRIAVGAFTAGSSKDVLVSAAYGEDCIHEPATITHPTLGQIPNPKCDPHDPSAWRIWVEAVYETIFTAGSYSTDPIVEPSTTWNNISTGSNQNSSNLVNSNNNHQMNVGGRFGLDGKDANVNGSYWINCRTGKIHFSSNLAGKTVILEYISDHLGTDDEMKVHKFAEEAMYKHIAHSILNTRSNVDRNVVSVFKKERSVAIRNAKLRLSSIKLPEITQILRGKSKWIKH